MIISIVNNDYYPFGMPMPNRNIQDANGYRYAYQGQEKDPETGKEAFELRLWDGRIGRWLTTDPKGVHHSPYLGMGNNPVSIIDPDGGCPCSECPENCGDGSTVNLDEVTVTGYIDKIKQDVFDGIVGWGNVFDRGWNWLKGTEPKFTEEYGNKFANSFKDAWRVNEARDFFYSELNRARDLGSRPITNYSGKFGLKGLQNAGLDPYEQFVGSYSITEIRLVTTGDVMEIQYTLINDTHAKSFTYGVGSSWDRETFAPGSTVRQEIIFSEKILPHRLNARGKGVINYHRLNNFVTPLR